MQKINVIQSPDKDHPFLIIKKAGGVPSAPLTEFDSENAFSYAAELFPFLKDINGKKTVEHGLVHRLDTDTEGLLLIAASQDFYDFIQQEQSLGRFIKTYKAECTLNSRNIELLEGFPPCPVNEMFYERRKFTVESYFRNYGEKQKQVRPVTKDSGKAALKKLGNARLYSTEISLKSIDSEIIDAECRIKAGYRHQVRCHLAWCNLPVVGDRLYNAEPSESSLKFYATGLEFFNPVVGKREGYKA